jgi:hypothetical protein
MILNKVEDISKCQSTFVILAHGSFDPFIHLVQSMLVLDLHFELTFFQAVPELPLPLIV